MVETTAALSSFLVGVMCLLGAGILLCLFRAMKGPRYTDRIVAQNAISTQVILLVCILSYILREPYLLDVAILYGLLNLLAIALLSRLTVTHHRERKEIKQ